MLELAYMAASYIPARAVATRRGVPNTIYINLSYVGPALVS